MEYSISKLAHLSGVSTRTLRYYDEMNLLKPARINSSGYRIYGSKEIKLLQQILFYRELGISLEEIKNLLISPSFDEVTALKEHRMRLLEKSEQIQTLICTVEKTIAEAEGRITMSDKEKFEGFKKNLIHENEEKYGKEIREKYGKDTINESNHKMMNMTKEEYDEVTGLANEILSTLKEAYKTGDPSSELAQKTAELHQRWISYYWNSYTKEAHAGVACMYVEDERFKKYYDQEQDGLAEFLRDAILVYTAE